MPIQLPREEMGALQLAMSVALILELEKQGLVNIASIVESAVDICIPAFAKSMEAPRATRLKADLLADIETIKSQ